MADRTGVQDLVRPQEAVDQTAQHHDILSIHDIQRAGSARLSRITREYIDSGATEESTVSQNTAIYSKYILRPRVLVDVREVDLTTTVWGRKIPFPLFVAPTGLQRLAHPDAELATARACAEFGTNMGISSFANSELQDILQAGDGKVGFGLQLYLHRDRGVTRSLVKMAEDAGCKAILVTADSPVSGDRWNQTRNNWKLPEGIGFPLVEKAQADANRDLTGLTTRVAAFMDDSQSWERDVPWLKSITKMQIWIKGVLTAEDTRLALKYGADGIIVSNHGGRQLDGVPATLDALPECVEAAGGRIPVYIDGGIRRGSDIFKALALGAECCLIGRVAVWGLAYDGQAGVELALKILYDDFKRTMQLMGCRSIKDISRSHLAVLNSSGFLQRLDHQRGAKL